MAHRLFLGGRRQRADRANRIAHRIHHADGADIEWRPASKQTKSPALRFVVETP